MKATAEFKQLYSHLFPAGKPEANLPEQPIELICHQGTTKMYCANISARYTTELTPTGPLSSSTPRVCGLINARYASCSVCPQTQDVPDWRT